ncbi:hypothetical protein [Phnomibacter sp. MR]|uniref:hypothetical protein n=1 Tax=Phnomibacter sp. MR TaxID=3042318 RepID=UPI003A80473A
MHRFTIYWLIVSIAFCNATHAQTTKLPLYFNTHVGVSLDGKGDVGGSSFLFGLQKALSSKHHIALNYEFFALKNDNSGFFEFRKSIMF